MNKMLVLGIAAAGLLGYMGYEGLTVLREKAQQQQAATEVVQRWKQTYQALAKSTAAWSTRYPDMAKFNDLIGLFRSVGLERYGLTANPDDLSVLRLEPVSNNDVSIGLARVCLGSSSATVNAGLQVTAPSYSALLAGVRGLSARKDIEISSLTVQGGEGGAPTATLGGFCLLLRQGEKA